MSVLAKSEANHSLMFIYMFFALWQLLGSSALLE